MPSSSKSTSHSSSDDSGTYEEPSNNSIYREYGGWPNYMHSHGLKPWDLDDVEEGKAITQAYKDMHRHDWEEAQKDCPSDSENEWDGRERVEDERQEQPEEQEGKVDPACPSDM